MFTLYWVREDGQGSYDMGSFETREAAEAAITAARTELVDQQGGDAEREAEIDAGRWMIAED